MWSYSNPVRVIFGAGAFERLTDCISMRHYAVVTYPEPYFGGLVEGLASDLGQPVIVINDVAPNPDYKDLERQCQRFAALETQPEVIVALGGGSVIDSAKVFAAASGNFQKVSRYLETGRGADDFEYIPLIAVPTTAGTGSEVTSWATVWDEERGRKYSLSRRELYPETAIVDPALMLGKSRQLTCATGLDALSHALESIWNINANPISIRFAVSAARRVLRDLPPLLDDLENLELRSSIAEAALCAGMAFSNTKTAISHNLSYPITLEWGVQHGIACSFTLPNVLRSVIGLGDFREDALKEIFGADLSRGAREFDAFFKRLSVATHPTDYGVPADRWPAIVRDAFAGERGKNFIGTIDRFLAAQPELET